MPRRSSLPSLILPLLLTFFYSLFAAAQAKPVDAEGHQWWQHAVFYEVYPRSFADSNDDGVGDLNGISSKMSYLQELGVDAIWITPCYPSPQIDFGYDVADYRNIDPMYGTLADFDRMVAEGRKHHVRIILDFVPTSTRGFWIRNLPALPRIATGTSGATARDPASLPTTGSQVSAARHGHSTPPPISTTIISSTRNSRT